MLRWVEAGEGGGDGRGADESEEEARRLFVAELVRSSEEGPAPDCAEQLATINAEFDAACAEMRKAESEGKRIRRR